LLENDMLLAPSIIGYAIAFFQIASRAEGMLSCSGEDNTA